MTLTASEMTEIHPFRVSREAVFKTMLLAPSSGWPVWVAGGVGLFLICFGSIMDIRWLLVGLMICVAVVPGIAALTYFNYTLSPEIVANMLPHTLERIPDGFLLRLWRHPDSDNDQESEGETDDGNAGGEKWEQTAVMSLSDKKIVDRKTTNDYEVFYFKDSQLKILYVPRY